jgi:hypothetical protein
VESIVVISLNVIVSACVIGFAAWLSGHFPGIAGFIVALPLATMLVLPLSQLQHGDSENTITFAKSIFMALPITLTFFVPFFVAERLGLSFWQAYALGCLALLLGYFLHRAVRILWLTGT